MTEESDFPTAWRPDEGDVNPITGIVRNVELIDPNGQGAYPVVTVFTAEGVEKAIHAFRQVLRRELAKRRPRVGDEITVHHLGKKEGGSFGGYYDYRVSGGQEPEFDWSSEIPASERPVEDVVPIAPAPAPSQQPVTVPVDDDSDLPF